MRLRKMLILLILLLGLVCIGIVGVRIFSRKSVARPNVILISIDTLRADHLHGYGYPRETSPFLDSMMEKGTAFLNCISPCPWTLPAHLSMFTSLYPNSHGVIQEGLCLPKNVETFPPVLKKQGYKTAAFATCGYLSPRYGFGRGFDAYVCQEVAAPIVCKDALEWLETTPPDENYLLFLHLYDVHCDYTPAAQYLNMFDAGYKGNIDGKLNTLNKIMYGEIKPTKEDLQHVISLYDAEIRQLDAALATFFHALEQRKLLENTIVVITADHGEEFLEHGRMLHGASLYDEVLRVPLIMVGPKIPPSKRISSQVELIDIMPTVMELCDSQSPSGIQGRSLVPFLTGNGEPWERAAFAEADNKNAELDIKRVIRTDQYKLYYDRLSGMQELYDLAADPREQTNVLKEHPQKASELLEQLQEWMKQNTRRGEPGSIVLTDSEKERLKALGYLK